MTVATFHQVHTYTNPNSGATLVIQNTGVARVYFDSEGNFTHFVGAGHTHIEPLDEGRLGYGLQNPVDGVLKGHQVSPCDLIG